MSMLPANFNVGRFVQLRLESAKAEEQRETERAVEAVNRDYRSRGTQFSGSHVIELTGVYLNGARVVLEKTLGALERDSADLKQAEFEAFWDDVRVALKQQIVAELQRRRGMVELHARASRNGGSGVSLALRQSFGQQASNLTSQLGGRVEEITMSRRLRGEGGGAHPGSIILNNSPGANVNTGHIGGSQTSNVTISSAAQILEQVREVLLRDPSLEPSDRQDALAEVQVVEAQLQKTKPNGRTIKESLDVLGKISSIGGLTLKLSEVLGPALLG